MGKEQLNSQLKKRSVFSVISLFFQSSYSAILGLGANIIITVILSQHVYGIYILVLSIISILNYFSDIGLAASLVQKKEINEDDIKTTFTIQETLIIILITLGFIVTPHITNFYNLPPEGTYLYWSLLIGFFISSLKTIPSILLERNIQFQKIVFVQIVENTVFYLVVSIAALFGLSLYSFTLAVLLRAIIGLILMYRLAFWMPKIGISLISLKSLLSYGAPIQASSFLALFKDEFVNLYLGRAVGLEGLGYIGWAKKWAEAPIRIIMDNVSKVMFPAFSRLQNDPRRLGNALQKVIYYQTMIITPTLIGIALIMPKLVILIPQYYKWLPAIPLLFLFCISAFFSSYSSPFINLFNAVGKVKITFNFMVFWTVATWTLTPLLIKITGLYGFPLTLIILSLAFIPIVKIAQKMIDFQFFPIIYPFILTTIIMGVGVYFITNTFGQNWLSVILGIISGMIIYTSLIKLIFFINIIDKIKELFHYE